MRILIVEDSEHIAQLLKKMLVDEGFAVDIAGDGSQALAFLKTDPQVDLILLDLRMPVLDGREFRAAQQSDPTIRSIPVVLMSGEDNSDEIASQLDIDFVIQKGAIQQDAITRLVRSILKTK